MNAIKLIFILCLVVKSLGYTPFRLTDCTSNTDRLLTIRGGLLEYPVQIPGHVRVNANVVVHAPVTAGRLRLHVTVQKWIVFDYFSLPCIFSVGSCSYDLCDLLGNFEDTGCPWQLEVSNFPCTCPFDNGTYTLQPNPFYISEVEEPWQWIAVGDFRVFGVLVDEETSQEVACYSVEFTTQGPPSFWSWW